MKKIRSILMVMAIFLMVSFTVSAEPGKIKVDGKLIEVDVIYDYHTMLINIEDYDKHFPCTITKDEASQTYSIVWPHVFVSRMGKFKVGERKYTYTMEDYSRVMNVPPTQVGNKVYVPVHILCIMSGDIVHYMADGKSLQISTQDAILDKIHADMDAAGTEEEWHRWERDRRFLGDTAEIEQHWPPNQIDSMPRVPRMGHGELYIFPRILAPEVDRTPESRQPTGKYKQYGAFKIPLLKGSKISGPDPIYRKATHFVEEIRQPYGLVILRVNPKGGYKGVLELALSRKADVDLALNGMREILSQCFDPAGVEKIIKQVKQISPMEQVRVDTYPVQSKSLTVDVMNGNITDGITAGNEVPFAKVTISLK